MEALKAPPFPSFHRQSISTRNPSNTLEKPILNIPSSRRISPLISRNQKLNLKTLAAAAISPAPLHEEFVSERFDWYEQWYPVWPVCDLDSRRPHAKKVMGIDLVVWWDRNENAWKVFDDSCPHRLAPLSEGRIDQWGRLQCVYHGWCFGGAGDCKFIPQAPRDGPPVHTSNKACVAVYPSCVQNGILWFWPNSDPQYKEIHSTKKPHYIPELDDPSFTNTMIARELAYGYEALIENLMDPAHVPYAHYGIIRTGKVPESLKADREGGRPLKISVQKVDVNGFTSKQMFGENHFIAPCLWLYYDHFSPRTNKTPKNDVVSFPVSPKKKSMFVFYCIPVSPGYSRLIFAYPRNFSVWMECIVPRWMSHLGQNLILDSDLNLLHERKLKEVGALNWQKTCYVPTKSDTLVATFRRWLNRYGGTQVDWRNKYTGELPPTPPREQLFDRYWTHTVSCSSCSAAYKRLNALEIALQVISIALIAAVAAAKQGAISIAVRYYVASMAVLCFVASKLLSHFIYKTFRYHDYDHSFFP
ncbi:protochlorophyllide-dependent translocon component 52, chloroplastic-like isoform X2 [Salvia hispanica]|uniref:protochlorophyllide-dependent translocon component 52, chloroplastic-like isoform X2 n=1 Tax=Salvia hispanica TaxID=49212 RepID=UPI002008F0DB|nr:protochlorophyllide-dependent translocon component 52, chloroplastic-like isoform X2 [Salvia hispanica]